jgi:hypothetical protein
VSPLRTKEDWIRRFPYLFQTAVIYGKNGKPLKLIRKRRPTR